MRQARIRKIDTAQNAQIRALEDVLDSPAAQPRAIDPAILGDLPYLGDILPSLPPRLPAFPAVGQVRVWAG